MARKIRLGMVGGGRGAFIGRVHRMAAALDGEIELVCGAFSSDAEKSSLTGEDLYLDKHRVYGSYREMILKESELPEDERIDLVSIVTPNHLHFEPAKMALEYGFNVICDKPLTTGLDEAYALRDLVLSSGKIFALTHNYSAYPMVKQARLMVQNGMLGQIRKLIVEYPQGWLSTKLEASNNKQAVWRTDPIKAGSTGAMGDIGTHAEQLAEYVSGIKIQEICADLHTHVNGRLLDDDGTVLMKFDNGARGVLLASQIAAGEENNLSIRAYGEKGGVEWKQMEPNSLIVRWLDKPVEVYRTGGPGLYQEVIDHTRLPAGHPEGYLEAFANIYRNVAKCIRANLDGQLLDPIYLDFPGIEDGVRGMEFLDAVVRSSKSEKKWIKLN
jgi:predicted dehydrogenase